MTSADLDRRLAALGRPFRLIVTGGGTGGHTYPALTAIRTTAARLDRLGVGLDVLWVGTATGLEARVTDREGIPFKTVATGKIRRSSNPLKLASPANIKDMGRVPLGAAQARSIVSDFKPDVVLSTGGYVAVPVGLAAKFCRRPLVIHEQTVRLGLANRALARAATRVAVSSESTLPLLPDSVRASAVVTGNPVRPEVLTGQPDKAIAALGLTGFDRALPTVYITGGAQGSVQINTTIRAVLPWLLTQANVIHQCGATSIEEARQYATQLPDDLRHRYLVTDFVGPELPDVLALADVVISRSGAGTIAELTALGKPSVLIPLATSAGNEQEHNALHLQQAGAAVALLKDAVTPEGLRDAVAPILAAPERREQMAVQARALGRPDAADHMTDVLLNVAV
ncbi:UDP-N-acetylglucosamine--N-acetylmuramyl-(pentapeptide) pyrophosphoryl-undecaprenol N-acetylglucosamine transferase [Streptomyces pacificus]|uniref:UDP-N-acetylglucosamine--N-acetylmuramyl-(pentapeptide) pyrophosphoryl-undecaprenol N-acetylglucosamine transferase n=1 Tax=Streptomyces pacificus TaxID=2705029 RepID=A0A6A0B440_9ACTN|nr:UDP-N-acetylglucosamine--N-acetylmuramyl-(pentapeptide) pyrophosphoryl-undecaprenol N-acetylglucosamine transferase [Streptomyces pacificus]GFH39465.1 UDP-N-acetylglucosamine--N-acetylmuramyl-(pentapeptide) pyrophosphoryl-undecaprenol N-acetylglucosamine transferase [Streptomyces pacificus]